MREKDGTKWKRGRPYSPDSRRQTVKFRLNEEEKDMLEAVCFEKNLSISEILRTGIRSQYLEIAKKR